MSDYSMADLIAAIGGGGNGWGGGTFFLVILVLVFFLCGGNGRWGNGGDYGQFATAASQQDILFSSKFQAIDNKIDRIGNGIADATYALKDSIVTEGRTSQKAIADMRYEAAQHKTDILAAIGADGEKTRDVIRNYIDQQKDARIRKLELDEALCGVVRYPQGMTWNAGDSPFCRCRNGCSQY